MATNRPKADRSTTRRARPLACLRTTSSLVMAIVVASCGQASISPLSSPAPARASTAQVAPAPGSGAAASPHGAALPSATVDGAPAVTFRAEVTQITLPAARSRAVAFVLGSTIVVSGGLTSAGTTTGSNVSIDVRSGRVRAFGSLASPVHDAGGAAFVGAGFVVGGGQLVAGSLVQRVGSTGTTGVVGRLPTARADLAAVAIDGELVIVGGGTPARPDDRVLGTTDGRHFRVIATLVTGVRYPAVAAFDGLIYVIGGSTTSGDTRLVQVIDPRNGDVRVVGRLARGLSHAAALVVGSALLVAGGRSGGRAVDSIIRIDPAGGTATAVAHLPYAVSDMASVVLDGTGYLVGGEAAHPIATIVAVTMQ